MTMTIQARDLRAGDLVDFSQVGDFTSDVFVVSVSPARGTMYSGEVVDITYRDRDDEWTRTTVADALRTVTNR